MQAGDIYRAGRSYGLMPIMAEVYNLGTPDYYAVAVVKIRDDDSELIYLKRRKSCHTGGRDDDKKYNNNKYSTNSNINSKYSAKKQRQHQQRSTNSNDNNSYNNDKQRKSVDVDLIIETIPILICHQDIYFVRGGHCCLLST